MHSAVAAPLIQPSSSAPSIWQSKRAIPWRVAIGPPLSKSRGKAKCCAPDTAFAPGEDRPALVLLDIQRSKRGADSGAVRPAANFQADNKRYPGVTALYNPSNDATRNIPATETSPMRSLSTLGPATPNLLLPAPALGAMPSGGNYPSPDSGTGEALRCYRAGLDAVAKGRSDEALRNFRRAYAFQAELDTITRKQLVDHLKILGDRVDPSLGVESSPAETTAAALIPAEARSGLVMTAATGPLPEPAGGVNQASLAPTTIASASKIPLPTPEPLSNDPPNKLNATGATGQALARQVAAEVAKQQGLARELKEKQPKQALETLQHTRDMVASVAGLETQARDQLVRRLDLSINELKQYIAQNASQINLEESNRKIQQSVDRSRQQRVEMQEKLAYLVNDFDKLMDEQRFSEAQVLAKRATELDPDNPLVTQLNVMARMIPRMAQNRSISDAKERGFNDMMLSIDRDAIPFTDDIAFPDKQKWEWFQRSKYRQQRDEQTRRTPKEIEIEQRLSTPVSVRFNNKPLSEVIEVLGGYAQVPTYLDPQGLQSEGVSSSQLVTIDLRNDISLKSALKLILEQFRLTYVIKDEVLKITSQDVRRGELIQKVYPVGDLIIPIPNFIPNGREGINAALREGFARTIGRAPPAELACLGR